MLLLCFLMPKKLQISQDEIHERDRYSDFMLAILRCIGLIYFISYIDTWIIILSVMNDLSDGSWDYNVLIFGLPTGHVN